MKLKELLPKICAGNSLIGIDIVDNNQVMIEDKTISDLPYGTYINLKNREVRSIAAPDVGCIRIDLEPDQ